MRITLGNREKKVIGGILTILFIAGIHLVVFSRKAKEYNYTMRDWKKAKNDVKNLVGQAKDPVRITRYEENNKKFEQEFKDIIKNLKIDIPKYYIDGSAESLEKRRRDFSEQIERLFSFSETLKNTKLTFLDEKGWDIPTVLPKDIRKRPERLWDVISQLHGISQILKVIDNEVVRQDKLRAYSALLKEIGIDEPRINALSKFGEYVPFINRFCHYRLIIKEKPKDVKMSDEEIQGLLRIKWTDKDANKALDNKLQRLNGQLFALNDLIEMADTHKIEEIKQVSLNKLKKVFTTQKTEEAKGEKPKPTPTPFRGEFEGRMRGPAEFGPEGGRGRMRFFEGFPMEFRARPKPEQPQGPPEDLVATAMPILIRFSGSNLNVTKYLYAVSHVPRTYKLDALLINTIKGKEGVEDVYASISVLNQVVGILVDLETFGKEATKKPKDSPRTGSKGTPPVSETRGKEVL